MPRHKSDLEEGSHLAGAIPVGVPDVFEREREGHEVDADVDDELHDGTAGHVAGQLELPYLSSEDHTLNTEYIYKTSLC